MRQIEQELAEIERQLADPVVASSPERVKELGRRRAELEPLVALWRDYEKAKAEAEDARALLAEADTEELQTFLREELERAEARAAELREKLLAELVPCDPLDKRNAVVEIRAGTGGEEAALFAKDLFEMYRAFAERRGWTVTVLDESQSDMGGYKEVVFQVEGPSAYGLLRLESGVHRVQRIPVTESQGRIHTSAASVAVLPEVEDVEVDINPSDLKIEAFRAGGPGGQHMQKNETAVRVTHLPTGISVTCSDARSQHQNREKAIRLLRSKLYELERQKREEELARQRKSQVRSGDRSEKIRTYNFPQDRITDHRIPITVYDIASRLAGDIDDLLEALQAWDRQQRLALLEAEGHSE
ncbi:MAG: peptide chain release factor 1 [Armatimonadetes bacterium]|nr:peptide chain release factor 1 [Armatimonadota bacterium]